MTWFVLASTNHPLSLSLATDCHLSHIISNHCSVALCNYQGRSHSIEITKSILSWYYAINQWNGNNNKHLSLMTPMLQGGPHSAVNIGWCFHGCVMSHPVLTLVMLITCTPTLHCQLRQLRCWWPLVPYWQLHSCDSIRHSTLNSCSGNSDPCPGHHHIDWSSLTASSLTSAFPWCWPWLAGTGWQHHLLPRLAQCYCQHSRSAGREQCCVSRMSASHGVMSAEIWPNCWKSTFNINSNGNGSSNAPWLERVRYLAFPLLCGLKKESINKPQ